MFGIVYWTFILGCNFFGAVTNMNHGIFWLFLVTTFLSGNFLVDAVDNHKRKQLIDQFK